MDKQSLYQSLSNSFIATLSSPLPRFVHLNNLCAMLKKEFGFFWVGFYLNMGDNNLQIGPYQGELPCFNINVGKGVCGSAFAQKNTIIVPDVSKFEGYIACHPEPKSEIVIPGIIDNQCAFVLDIDHTTLDYFDATDKEELEALCQIIATRVL